MAREFSREFYKSKEWRITREYVLKRDCYLCQYCGQPAEEVHHIVHLTPQNITDLSVCLNPNNLVSLCRNCHFEAHRGEHGQGRKSKEEDALNDYVFDERGMLVRRAALS